MTTIDACQRLHKWFLQNDTFNMEQDLSNVILLSNDKERDKAACLSALEEYEKGGFVSKQTVDDKQYWVMKKAFSAFEQTVSISAAVANLISSCVNDYCEEMGDFDKQSNPLEIKEKDIALITYVLTSVMDKAPKGKGK